MEKKLVPANATQFPGSFASGLRQDQRKQAETIHWRAVWRTYFTDGWNDISIWKSAVSSWLALVSWILASISLYLGIDCFQFIEFVGTTSLCYLSAMIDTTIGNLGTMQVAGYVGVTNIFLLTLFIYALAPSSGGHVNPLISFTTMITGLTGFSRGILYMIAQTAGAGLAGGLIRGSFGPALTKS